MKRNPKSKKPFWILLSVMAGASALLVLLASIGIFQGYRYDDSGFTVGGGTIGVTVREIEVDWLTGPIRVEASEDDRYLSVSEYASGDLATRDQLRWSLDENGKLTIMARASAEYLIGKQTAKVLILRIPSSAVAELERLTIRVRNGAGEIGLETLPPQIDITVDQGNTQLTLPDDAGFTLSAEGIDSMSVVPNWTERDGTYIRLDGQARLHLVGGDDLAIYTKARSE